MAEFTRPHHGSQLYWRYARARARHSLSLRMRRAKSWLHTCDEHLRSLTHHAPRPPRSTKLPATTRDRHRCSADIAAATMHCTGAGFFCAEIVCSIAQGQFALAQGPVFSRTEVVFCCTRRKGLESRNRICLASIVQSVRLPRAGPDSACFY